MLAIESATLAASNSDATGLRDRTGLESVALFH